MLKSFQLEPKKNTNKITWLKIKDVTKKFKKWEI
jgi:hypothetical protein